MATIIATVNGVKTEHEIDCSNGFICLLHQQGMRVDIPTFVEINGRNTIDCMEKMNQAQWEWISTGKLFRCLFAMAFDESQNIEIPKTIDELKQCDFGVIHICGLIILALETTLAGKNVFFRNPEDNLHPKTERNLVTLLYGILKITGQNGTITKEGENHPPLWGEYTENKINKIIKEYFPETKEAEEAEDKNIIETVVKWLEANKASKGDRPFIQVDDRTYTYDDVIDHVKMGTTLGLQVIEGFMSGFQKKEE